MPFIVTETHYEYNDETYNSPDARRGEEPGTPVAVFDNAADAEDDRWKREIEAWRNMDELAGYVDEVSDEEPDDWYKNRDKNRYDKMMTEYKEKVRKYAEITGQDPLDVKFGYDFKLPDGLSDEQVRKVVEMFDGPHFYNVFKV